MRSLGYFRVEDSKVCRASSRFLVTCRRLWYKGRMIDIATAGLRGQIRLNFRIGADRHLGIPIVLPKGSQSGARFFPMWISGSQYQGPAGGWKAGGHWVDSALAPCTIPGKQRRVSLASRRRCDAKLGENRQHSRYCGGGRAGRRRFRVRAGPSSPLPIFARTRDIRINFA